jgi:hypothetical protein
MPITEQVLTVLVDARDLLLTREWLQGWWALDAGGYETDVSAPDACGFCLVGAAYAALGGIPDQGDAERDALADAVFAEIHRSGVQWPISWNDAPERKKADVIDLLTRTIHRVAFAPVGATSA